jgi:6-phospho-beta-glucosidase
VLNDRLFTELAAAGADRRQVYEEYVAARNAGYMRIESGSDQPIQPSPWAGLTGYDKIALSVIHAIHFDTGAVIPLNVRNDGTIGELEDADVVEVPCEVTASGARPTGRITVPSSVRDLLLRVKEYERLTIAAAASRSIADAERALAANPLVHDADHASRLAAALGPW